MLQLLLIISLFELIIELNKIFSIFLNTKILIFNILKHSTKIKYEI